MFRNIFIIKNCNTHSGTNFGIVMLWNECGWKRNLMEQTFNSLLKFYNETRTTGVMCTAAQYKYFELTNMLKN